MEKIPKNNNRRGMFIPDSRVALGTSYGLDFVYCKVPSRNTCYYSGNQKFGILKSRLITPPFVLKQNRRVLKQHEHV